MKTLLLALEFPPAFGGVETYYANLVKYWPDEMSIIDNHDGALVKRSYIISWLPALQTILKAAKNTQPDWFIIGEILPLGTAACLASRVSKVRYAVFLHGLDFTMATRSSWKRFLTRRILNRSGVIFCANSRTAELTAAFLGSGEKIRIMNPGVIALPEARPELITGLSNNYGLENNIVLLQISRLVKRKGIDMTLQALPQVLEKVPNLRYVIIGQGPEHSFLQAKIDELQLNQKVILLTNVEEEQKWAWLSLSDIFIMAARDINGDYEGFGIVYLEANLAGKAVIAGQGGGVLDAVIDGVNGRVVNAEKVSEISAAIIELALDSDLRTRLGDAGQKRAQEDFAWPKRVQEIYDSLKKIV